MNINNIINLNNKYKNKIYNKIKNLNESITLYNNINNTIITNQYGGVPTKDSIKISDLLEKVTSLNNKDTSEIVNLREQIRLLKDNLYNFYNVLSDNTYNSLIREINYLKTINSNINDFTIELVYTCITLIQLIIANISTNNHLAFYYYCIFNFTFFLLITKKEGNNLDHIKKYFKLHSNIMDNKIVIINTLDDNLQAKLLGITNDTKPYIKLILVYLLKNQTIITNFYKLFQIPNIYNLNVNFNRDNLFPGIEATIGAAADPGAVVHSGSTKNTDPAAKTLQELQDDATAAADAAEARLRVAAGVGAPPSAADINAARNIEITRVLADRNNNFLIKNMNTINFDNLIHDETIAPTIAEIQAIGIYFRRLTYLNLNLEDAIEIDENNIINIVRLQAFFSSTTQNKISLNYAYTALIYLILLLGKYTFLDKKYVVNPTGPVPAIYDNIVKTPIETLNIPHDGASIAVLPAGVAAAGVAPGGPIIPEIMTTATILKIKNYIYDVNNYIYNIIHLDGPI